MLKLQRLSDTADIQVVHPQWGVLQHDDGRKLTVTVVSTESIEYEDALNKSANRIAGVNFKKLSAAEKREFTIQLLADCIVSFNNFDDVDLGNGIVDPSDKVGILRQNKWLRELIDSEMGDLGNFVSKPTESKKKG